MAVTSGPTEEIWDIVCRKCGKTFQATVKVGLFGPTNFVPKYCPECDKVKAD